VSGTYFFTLATYERTPLLSERPTRDALRAALHRVRKENPFTIKAWVLLPDHLHCIWTLPEGDTDFSGRWVKIKAQTTQTLRAARGSELMIWQPQYWDHLIRDEEDFRRHLDYVHWNPVKHGLASSAAEWPYSTMQRYIERGTYPSNWRSLESRFAGADYGE
jgi:putative transposase